MPRLKKKASARRIFTIVGLCGMAAFMPQRMVAQTGSKKEAVTQTLSDQVEVLRKQVESQQHLIEKLETMLGAMQSRLSQQPQTVETPTDQGSSLVQLASLEPMVP